MVVCHLMTQLQTHPPNTESLECTAILTSLLVDGATELPVGGDLYQDANDTRVFYPHARSYQSRSLPSLYKRFESEKKREYGERINTVEHGSFTPLVFSACGGMGHEATVVVRKLASALASKRRETYSRVINWLRCRLSFSLARSAIRCVRGSRSIRCKSPSSLAPVDLVCAEAHFDLY